MVTRNPDKAIEIILQHQESLKVYTWSIFSEKLGNSDKWVIRVSIETPEGVCNGCFAYSSKLQATLAGIDFILRYAYKLTKTGNVYQMVARVFSSAHNAI